MRALFTLALVAFLSSCAALPAPPAGGFDPAQYDGQPLRARIINGAGQLMVNTNRPAHVAIFEIVPGQGAGLLYPAYRGESNYLSGGMSNIFLSQSRSYYSYFQPAPYTSSRVGNGPRYLYMIASDAPLRLGNFLSAPGALRRSLGLARFASGNAYSLMDDLADLVLPYGAAGDWTDDVFVVWPDRSYDTGRYSARDWIRVQCSDGRVIQGPAYYVYGACARANDVPPLRPEREEPSDSSAPQPPTRRRPEPRNPVVEGVEPAPPPVVVEAIPEPEPARRPRERLREAIPERQSADSPRSRDARSGRGERRSEPRQEPRSESPTSRQEPRVERPAPRSEPAPRAESPRTERPRAEPATRLETPAGR